MLSGLSSTRSYRRRSHDLGVALAGGSKAIFYVLRGGVARGLLPTDLRPRTTVYRWFALWRDTGLFES
jgi:transposase